jgi:hypothetical protein
MSKPRRPKTQPTAAVFALMARAAELRAGGQKWEAVAAQLKRSAAACREWRKTYPAVWEQLLRDAHLQVAAEAGSEAVLVLRNLLRSDDEKVKRDAAVALLRLNPPARDESAGQDLPKNDAGRIAAYLESLDDAETQRLIDDAGPADGRPLTEPARPAGANVAG